MLYGNTQVVMRMDGNLLPVPKVALPHVVRFHLAISSTDLSADLTTWIAAKVRFELPSVRVVSLHIDIDFTRDECIQPTDLRPLLAVDTERISFVIDLHVSRTWSCDGLMMDEVCEKDDDEEAARAAKIEAFRMRGLLINCMEQWAKEDGKRFNVLEG